MRPTPAITEDKKKARLRGTVKAGKKGLATSEQGHCTTSESSLQAPKTTTDERLAIAGQRMNEAETTGDNDAWVLAFTDWLDLMAEKRRLDRETI